MKIVRIEAVNFMGLRQVTIEPGNRHAVLIGGNNAQGKSSLIGAIAGCFSGREVADEPIRRGQKRAEIRMDTEDPEWEIVRKFGKSGTTLTIKNADGKVQKKPQKLLDEIIGKRCLDPLAFMRLKQREQRDMLVSVIDIGIDLFAHDCERKKVYDERSNFNSDVKRLRFEVTAKEDTTPVPDEIDVSVVIDELRKLREVETTQGDDMRKHASIVEAIATGCQSIEQLDKQLAEAKANVAQLDKQLHAAELDLGTHVSELDLAKQVADAEDAISGAAKSNADREAIIAAREAHASLAGELKQAERGARDCKRTIDRLDDKKADALAAAEMPVDGLGFDEDGVLYNGVPLSQASGAERLRVSLALAAAMSPELRDIWTTDAALLDPDSLEVVKAFAAEHEPPLRFWLERVGEGDEGAIIIRDGEVVGAQQEAA